MQKPRELRRQAFRFSLKALLLVIVPISAGLAALRDATTTWLSGVVTITLLAILASTLAAIYGSRSRRPMWGSFAICCGAYFLLAVLTDDNWMAKLATTKLSERLMNKVHPSAVWPRPKGLIPVVGQLDQDGRRRSNDPRGTSKLQLLAASIAELPCLIYGVVDGDTTDLPAQQSQSAEPPGAGSANDSEVSTEDTARSLWTGENAFDTGENFMGICQCLWAWIMGAVGGLLTVRRSRCCGQSLELSAE